MKIIASLFPNCTKKISIVKMRTNNSNKRPIIQISVLLFKLCKLCCNYSNSLVGSLALLALNSIISSLFCYYAHFMVFIPQYGRHILVTWTWFAIFFYGILWHAAHNRTLKKINSIYVSDRGTPSGWFAIIFFHYFSNISNYLRHVLLLHIMHIPSMEI